MGGTSPARILAAAIFFALAVTVGELTFGNPDFPVTVWRFEKIPAWQWSLPVHAAGFLWILACQRWFSRHPAAVPVLLGTLFFLAGESLNWFVFRFFAYGGETPAEQMISFWLVILMYAALCAAVVWLLRIGGTRSSEKK